MGPPQQEARGSPGCREVGTWPRKRANPAWDAEGQRVKFKFGAEREPLTRKVRLNLLQGHRGLRKAGLAGAWKEGQTQTRGRPGGRQPPGRRPESGQPGGSDQGGITSGANQGTGHLT